RTWRHRGRPSRAPPNSMRRARPGRGPLIARNVVVLPAPFEPISATASPRRTSSETPATAVRSPYPATISSTRSSADILVTEIGLDHLRMIRDIGRRPLGDPLAEA